MNKHEEKLVSDLEDGMGIQLSGIRDFLERNPVIPKKEKLNIDVDRLCDSLEEHGKQDRGIFDYEDSPRKKEVVAEYLADGPVRERIKNRMLNCLIDCNTKEPLEIPISDESVEDVGTSGLEAGLRMSVGLGFPTPEKLQERRDIKNLKKYGFKDVPDIEEVLEYAMDIKDKHDCWSDRALILLAETIKDQRKVMDVCYNAVNSLAWELEKIKL